VQKNLREEGECFELAYDGVVAKSRENCNEAVGST